MGRKPLTAIRKQTSQKRKQTGPKKKKSLENIFIPDFFGGETSHCNKNKQTSKKKKKKKKKKTGTTKKLEKLGVVMVAILTEAFKLLHLQVSNIANIK